MNTLLENQLGLMTDEELKQMGGECAVTYALAQAITAISHDKAMEFADIAAKIADKYGMSATDLRRCGNDAKNAIDAEVPQC